MTMNEALYRYETACANAELISPDGWRTLARDLCDAADALEGRGTGVEQQRKLRDRAQDCAVRARRAESRQAAGDDPMPIDGPTRYRVPATQAEADAQVDEIAANLRWEI